MRPNPFYPAGGGEGGVLHLQFILPADHQGWDACVYDLWGHQVRDLGGDSLGPGPRDVVWDGRNDDGDLVVFGAYVVLLRSYDAGDQLVSGQKRLAVVGTVAAP